MPLGHFGSTQAPVDPIGDLVDDVAEMILEYRPTGRRRLTTSEPSARELAQQIVDYIWTYDYEGGADPDFAPGGPADVLPLSAYD